MPRRVVDPSIFLDNDVLSDPPSFAPKIQYFTPFRTRGASVSWTRAVAIFDETFVPALR